VKSNAELTKRQLQVLPYLLACSTYEEVAYQAHVSVKQIYYWLKTSTFKPELDRRRNEIIEPLN
jgi:DNA-binding CsgD family transcriptional regulator